MPVTIARFSWHSPVVLAQSCFPDRRVRFLGEDGRIGSPADWNGPAKSKLWLYNLHYFDDLNAQGGRDRLSLQRDWVRRWIEENPPPNGNGWEPYPISLRLVNWIKWLAREKVTDDLIIRSIMQQVGALTKRIEYHILGNHFFANAKALVFAGAFLTGDVANSSLRKGLGILKREVGEQFLSDGGHFERSPMYHAIMLWDLLDLINLSQTTRNPALQEQVGGWMAVAEKALIWLQVMTHPDGEVSFFNDSAFGIAPKLSDLVEYARQLGVKRPGPLDQSLILLEPSGYSRINMPQHTLLVDHAPVGPDYQPGHAHADSLSIEWSVGGERVLVNSGTSLYGASKERLRQRQTAAHNTVVVDGRDSSEVWGGFRVARRATSKLVSSKVSPETVSLVMSHNGYCSLANKVTHERTVTVSPQKLLVEDWVIGRFKSAEAIFRVHPNIAVNPEHQNSVRLRLPSGKILSVKASHALALKESSWHPRFGASQHCKAICVTFQGPESEILFSIEG